MVQTRDGTIWNVQPEDLIHRARDEAAFAPFSAEEMSRQLVAELPSGFEAYRTVHYVILHNTSREYAHWCGSLFERLYDVFTKFWADKGFHLSEPEFPLAADRFLRSAIVPRTARGRSGRAWRIDHRLLQLADQSDDDVRSDGRRGRPRRPAAGHDPPKAPDRSARVGRGANGATIVHEATHQIAFNCGLHTRFSDCPRWFSEGLAIYFETLECGPGEHNRQLNRSAGRIPEVSPPAAWPIRRNPARRRQAAARREAAEELLCRGLGTRPISCSTSIPTST